MPPGRELVMKNAWWFPLVIAVHPAISPRMLIIQAALLEPPKVPKSNITGFIIPLVSMNACTLVPGRSAAPTIQPLSLMP